MYEDTFRVDEENEKIVCHSKSGNNYHIYFKNGGLVCTCKGFEVRKDCRHVKEANELGFVEDLTNCFHNVNEDEKDNFCRQCGKAFDADDNYCGHCGKKRA